MTETFQKLVDLNIELLPLPEITTHFVFHRGDYAALVQRVHEGFGSIGTAGLLTDKGIAPLQWRAEGAFFVAKGFEQPASTENIAAVRAFQNDLQAALA